MKRQCSSRNAEMDTSDPAVGVSNCKRSRYTSESEKENVDQWRLSDNEFRILNEVFDDGVKPLDSESEVSSDDEKQWNHKNTDLIDVACSSMSPESLKKQITLLESTLMKETLQKLSSGEWERLVTTKPKNDHYCATNYFERLSDEVLLHIFHFLPRNYLHNVSLVCKRFHQLSQDNSLWIRMDVSGRNLGEGCLGHIISRQVVMLRLSQAEIAHPAISPGTKAYSSEFSCRLMYLDLSMAIISKDSLADLFNKCHRLKNLSLEHVPVDDTVLLALSRNKDLEVLNLAMVEGLQLDGLYYLLSNCRRIKELNIAWTYLPNACIQFICLQLPTTVCRLNFSGCQKNMSDKNVADLIRSCPDLCELDLSDCTGLTGQAVQYISLLEDLNFLALSRCYFIPYRALLILKKLKSLAYLDIHGGYIDGEDLQFVQNSLGTAVHINKFKFSSVARPTVGPHRTRIWGMRMRDY